MPIHVMSMEFLFRSCFLWQRASMGAGFLNWAPFSTILKGCLCSREGIFRSYLGAILRAVTRCRRRGKYRLGCCDLLMVQWSNSFSVPFPYADVGWVWRCLGNEMVTIRIEHIICIIGRSLCTDRPKCSRNRGISQDFSHMDAIPYWFSS